MKVKKFNKIKRYSDGSGVTAAADSSIHMELNEYGLYEEIFKSSPHSKISPIVKYVSPMLNKDRNASVIGRELFADVKNIQFDSKTGYYLSCYAGYVSESNYRKNASSGGMGTWIFKELFEKDLIDGVIHVKENPDKHSPILFKYDVSRTIEEIQAGAKTKYYPVELSEVLKIVKDTPGRYAVIGIPSFITGIRLLADKDPVIKKRIKYTVGLICGHQKSSKFAESIAWQVGIKPGNLKHVDFRKKLLDRPANDYGIELTGVIEGKVQTIIKPTKELLGQNWGHGFFKAVASDFTDDVMNETADITLGDAWLPEYTQDSLGNNVVIVRHPGINELILDGIQQKKLSLDTVEKDVVLESQNAHFRHTREELPYRLYKKDQSDEWRPKTRVEANQNMPLLRKKVQDLREEISLKSHLIYKEAVERDDLDYFIEEMSKPTKKYSLIYKTISLKSKVKRAKELGVSGTIKKIKERYKK